VDNIYLNGSILGMSRSEIRKKFDEIVSFSEVEDFLHVPVKRYSSGMRVRLAFSVAAHLDPDILIIDEVLAVGDLAFQEKCLQRMSEFASTGRTILFVSHNVPAIQSLCKRVIQLSAGRIVADGPTKQVLPQFVRSMTTNASDAASADVNLIDHPMRKRGHVPILTRIRLLDSQNRPTCVIASGESCAVEVEYRTPQIKSGLAFRLTFSTTQGERIASLHSRVQSKIVTHGEASGTVRCSIPSLILLPDDYRIEVAVGTWDQTLDSIDPALQVTVSPTDLFGTGELLDSSFGPTVLRSDWSSTGQPVIAATHAPSTDSSVPMPVLSSVRDPSKTRAFSSASYSPYDWH
jgi:lipopolysaccharide transport system ATP-binding protein